MMKKGILVVDFLENVNFELILPSPWTSTRTPPRNGLARQTGPGWEPNHFVPLTSTNRPMEKVELPEITDYFKDISNIATNPLSVEENHQKKSSSLSTSAKPKQRKSSNPRAAVRKGSHMASAGVQHSDCGLKTNQTEDSCKSPSETDVNSKQPNTLCKKDTDTSNVAKKGSACISPGVQHTDCKLDMLKADPVVQYNFDFDHENSLATDMPPIDTGVSSSPNLSTIEEESSVLHEASPARNTSQLSNEPHQASEEPETSSRNVTKSLNISTVSSDLEDTIEEQFNPGPLKKYMVMEEILNILKGPNYLLPEILVGRKDGMYFILDDSTNVQRRREGKPSQYWHDSGVWSACSSPPTPFVFQNGKWKSLRLKQGVYCVLKYKNKKEEYVPLDPQPNPEDVVKVHRLYHKLQVDKPDAAKFQRRIMWIEKSDSILQEIPPVWLLWNT